MKKVVVDTNVLISAFLFKGRSAAVLEYIITSHQLYFSDWLLDEFYEKLRYKFNVDVKIIEEIIEVLSRQSINIAPFGVAPDICSDKDDNNVLHLVEYATADYLVTGDKQLLKINQYKSCKILNPTDFFEAVNNE